MSTTREWVVVGTLIIEGKDDEDCEQEAERQLGEVFFEWTKKEVR